MSTPSIIVPSIEAWMPEVRRLCAALTENGALGTYDVILKHQFAATLPANAAQPSRVRPAHWRAECGHGYEAAPTADAAMTALLAKLRRDLAAKVAAKRAELAKLTAALDGGEVVPLRAVPRGGGAS
jgi:hypothetical protein